MEIFAAIVVVVPLIVPLGAAFGIHPVHLGIIFIANLELGFLTPLVGLNIFLASYRFKRPVLEVCRAALPMMAILGIGVCSSSPTCRGSRPASSRCSAGSSRQKRYHVTLNRMHQRPGLAVAAAIAPDLRTKA